MRQSQSKKFTKRNSKKNSKYSQNMRGGASGSRMSLPTIPVHSAMSGAMSGAMSSAMSSDDNTKLFEAILNNKDDRFTLNQDVFEHHSNGGRLARQIKKAFHDIINKAYNDRGQTALYVVLRFNPTISMIQMLLEVPDIDVNRKNKPGLTDESTPLMGLCFGQHPAVSIKWQNISDIISLLCKKGADMTLQNKNGETALQLLDRRIKTVDFT
jgi:ankyrin repeat protein